MIPHEGQLPIDGMAEIELCQVRGHGDDEHEPDESRTALHAFDLAGQAVEDDTVEQQMRDIDMNENGRDQPPQFAVRDLRELIGRGDPKIRRVAAVRRLAEVGHPRDERGGHNEKDAGVARVRSGLGHALAELGDPLLILFVLFDFAQPQFVSGAGGAGEAGVGRIALELGEFLARLGNAVLVADPDDPAFGLLIEVGFDFESQEIVCQPAGGVAVRQRANLSHGRRTWKTVRSAGPLRSCYDSARQAPTLSSPLAARRWPCFVLCLHFTNSPLTAAKEFSDGRTRRSTPVTYQVGRLPRREPRQSEAVHAQRRRPGQGAA